MFLKKIVLLFIVLFFTNKIAIAVCPVGSVLPVENIKEQVEKQLKPILEYIFFTKTPTGFVISINDDMIFDTRNNITISGKLLLVQMAQIMKTSGHKWQIYCHSDNAQTQLERISITTEQAVKITNFLTENEKCLLNQIIPIGFGSIMPVKHLLKNQSQNRIDFIAENFLFNR